MADQRMTARGPSARSPVAGWRHLRFCDAELSVPEELAASAETGIEGPVAVLEGRGLRLTLDASPFADPLTGYGSKGGYRRWQEEIGGRPREFVSFEDDGGRVVATRLQGSLTAVVHLASAADEDVALNIVRSIAPRQGETDD